MQFKEITVEELNLNPMTMIGNEWWLITAGNEKEGYNTMTAAWGQLGAVWDIPGAKRHEIYPTASVYVRPQRYTKQFLDRKEIFTLSVLEPGNKKALAYLGSHSGRDEDKIANAGLTPVFTDGTTYFEEAAIVFICRKLYHAPLIESGFTDHALVERNYPERDFHEMYVGEIIRVYRKEK